MKKRRKWTVPLALVVFLALSALLITSLDLSAGKPDYTIFNYRKAGVSLLYDTLNRMGYSTAPEYQKIAPGSDIHTIRLVIQPNSYYMSNDDEEDLLEYVYNGGRVIYLADSSLTVAQTLVFMKNALIISQKDDFLLLSYGLGQIFLGPPSVTNENLIYNRDAGYYVADVIQSWQGKKIYINEAYHGFTSEPNIWDVTPANIKNSAYQLIIVILLIILYLGKRFGRPIPYYEEIEREENEYLIALANVYSKSGNGYIIYESDLERFLKNAAQRLGVTAYLDDRNSLIAELLNEWKNRSLPYYDDFIEVIMFSEKDFKTKSSAGRRRLYKARLMLDRLEKCI